MHLPYFCRLARFGNPVVLLLTSLTLPALTDACHSKRSPTGESAPGSEGTGAVPTESKILSPGGSGGEEPTSSSATGGSGGGASTSVGGSSAGGNHNGGSSGSGGSSGGSANGGSANGGMGGASSGGSASSSGGCGADGVTPGRPSTTSASGGDAGAAGPAGAAGAGGEVAEAVAPALGDILVSTGATLTPAFSENRRRYSILPELGQSLAVAAIASEQLTISIGGEPAESSEPIPVELVETGSELEIVVSNSLGDSETYTLLILPTDFPKFVVTTPPKGCSDPLSDPLYVTPSSTSSRYSVKLDNDGVPLFYTPIVGRSYDFKKHPTGQMSYAKLHDGQTERIVLDSTFAQADVVRCVGANTDMHDFLVLENGNFILVCNREAVRDLSSCGAASNATVIDNIVQELSPEQELLFEWNSWDHTECGDALRLSSGDLAHVNSVVVDTDGDWILSLRYMSQIVKIDKTTGDVIWRLGGLRSDFDFVDDPWGGLCGQHTASRLANGHILAFDNGNPCAPNISDRPSLTRVVEYELDELAMTATLVWSYSKDGLYTQYQGSAQRLDNGNTVIGWGADQDDPLFVTEVDSSGQIVFELEATVAGEVNPTSYRALRYPD